MALGTSRRAATPLTLTGRAATTRQENACWQGLHKPRLESAAACERDQCKEQRCWQQRHLRQQHQHHGSPLMLPSYGAFTSQSPYVPHVQQNCCPPPTLHTSDYVGEGGSACRRAACAARVVHGHNPARLLPRQAGRRPRHVVQVERLVLRRHTFQAYLLAVTVPCG